MTFEVLEEFCAVADFQSISKAADYLYVSQPTLSRHISELEQELGVQLIQRDSRSFSLTPAGEAMYTSARNLIAQQKAMVSQVQFFSTIPFCRDIAIAAPDLDFPPFYEACREFQEEYPSSGFTIRCDKAEHCLHDVLQRKAHLGIGFSFDMPQHLRQLALEQRILGHSDWCVAVPLNSPFAERQSVTLTELSDASFITTNHICYDFYNDRVAPAYQLCREGSKLRQIPMTSVELVLLQIRCGCGMAILPRPLAKVWPDIRILDLEGPETRFDIVAFWLQERTEEDNGLTAFLDILGETCGEIRI
ncbi:MAG: LysR family transcriptional regulator [Oscillospiraceae bacterium]|nr:LysR family transcriptional regulator [Oscillospiraceae bacterium]